MANTYTELTYHCVFSTKNRANLISADIEEKIWGILAETAKHHQLHSRRIGGIENHVHLLIDIPKTLSVSEAMKQLKGGSSNAINRSNLVAGNRFAWQDGYSAFSVSASASASVASYIANQREHHKNRTFEEELRLLLEKHNVEYDEAYLLG